MVTVVLNEVREICIDRPAFLVTLGTMRTTFILALTSLAMRLAAVIGFGVLRALAAMPQQWRVTAGAFLGRQVLGRMQRRQRIASDNLQRCFPQQTQKEHADLLNQVNEANGIGAIEAGVAWWQKEAELRSLYHISGQEHIDKALDTGCGVILISAHLTTMELCARFIALDYPCWVVQRQQKNEIFDRRVQALRLSYLQGLILHDDMRAMIETLRAGKILCTLPDHDMGRRKSVFAPFFGVPAATIKGLARLAVLTDAVVVPVFCHRREGRDRLYELVYHPPLSPYPTGDAVADATLMNQVFEGGIRRHPEQYIWYHRRFKTKPS